MIPENETESYESHLVTQIRQFIFWNFSQVFEIYSPSWLERCEMNLNWDYVL